MESAAVPAGDLVPKYQKLAAEYSKLRVHVKVLKKGVLEEQARGAELRELLREKEKALRKSELEIDSLTFRNTQLTRRISVLQDELDGAQNKSNKKGRTRGGSGAGSEESRSAPDSGLLQEELQKKILENAQYSSLLSDRVFEISQLRATLTDYEKMIGENEAKYKCEIAKLKHKNQEIQYQLEELVKERGSRAPSRHQITTPAAAPPAPPLAHSNPPPPCNGDFLSEIGSIVGSEDALSSVEDLHVSEQLCIKTQLLEQDNDRLKMECELMIMENESLKLEIMKHSTVRRRGDRHDSGDFNAFAETTTDASGRVLGLLGAMEVPFDLSEEIRAREEKLQKYFRSKITELAVEKQALESKTDHYTRECELLRLRYEEAEKENEITDRTLQHKHDTITRLEEELQSTSHNYEQQMSVLTEHVADLTDRLSQQHDEIQRLRAPRRK